jgi:hypothetical protein
MQQQLGSPRQPSSPVGSDLAGSLPRFAREVGSSLATSTHLTSFRQKQLLFSRIDMPGRIHVYSTDCQAGERLRVQLLVPVLPAGGALAPAVAVVAQSLPYSADVQKLPLPLPAGYSAVVAPPPGELVAPVYDLLTRAGYYPGPVIDTRTLVGGRCYVVVWSPHRHMGKYVLQLGFAWPWYWTYWLQLPRFWWQIRGWFGLSRWAAYAAGAGLLVLGLVARRLRRRRRARRAMQRSAVEQTSFAE